MLKNEYKQALVTVVVPIYNISEYLPECVESICHQTYSNLEIILVNDGSSDSSLHICEKYAEKDNRIIVINKENGGLVAARKTGIEMATGEYLLNVDGDDWIELDMIQSMIDKGQDDEYDFVQCGFIEHGQVVKRHIYPENTFELTQCIKNEILSEWLCGKARIDSQIVTKLFRTSFIKEHYKLVPDNMSIGEDCMSYVLFLNSANKIASMSESFYNYRIRTESLSHSQNLYELSYKYEVLIYEMVKMFQSYLPNLADELVDKWILRCRISYVKYNMNLYGINVLQYCFPQIGQLIDKNIIIYGAGSVGRDFIMQLSEYEKINIVGWIDKCFDKYNYEFRIVEPVSSLLHKNFDVLIVAVNNEKVAKEIHDELIDTYSISEEQIIWEYDRSFLAERKKKNDEI